MTRIPLFLLHTVLFPGARLPLKVFEARYLDMVSACLRDKQPFGVCLIKSGQEVGDAGEPHRVGTLAHIEEWEMPTTGILHILSASKLPGMVWRISWLWQTSACGRRSRRWKFRSAPPDWWNFSAKYWSGPSRAGRRTLKTPAGSVCA